MPKPPRDLDYFDKVNYVIDAWSRPCVAPWYIYVETLKPALLTAFITLITFGWDDVARGYFRPKGLGSRRTGKRKGKFLRKVPRFPELGEMIGEKLPGSDSAKGVRWSTGLKTLWRIDTIIQQYLFWWLVADVTIDLAYNWTSVLYETYWCRYIDLGRFSYRLLALKPMPADSWWTASIPDMEYEEGPPWWTVTHGNTGPNGALIAYALRFEQWPGQPAATTFQSRLVDRDTLEIFSESGELDADADGKATTVIQAHPGSDRKFKVQVRSAPGPAYYTDGFITGLENEPA